MHKFYRTEVLIGKSSLNKLKGSKTLVLGLGGVGGIVIEMLARAGIQNFVLVDFDKIEVTNITRQILALNDNIGEFKTKAAEIRLKQINPDIKIKTYEKFATAEDLDEFLTNDIDIVVDAIDPVKAKVSILEYLYKKNIPVISSMGAGFKTDPMAVKIGDVFESKGCRLASAIRKNLRKKGITHGITCVYSDEETTIKRNPGSPIGSICVITNLFGIMIAHAVIQKLLSMGDTKNKDHVCTTI